MKRSLFCLILLLVSTVPLMANESMDALANLQEEQVAGSPEITTAEAHAGELGIVASETSLALRSGPGSEFDVLCKVPSGAELEIVGEKDGWLQVNCSEGKGWICGHLVWRESRPRGFFQRLADKARTVIDRLRGRTSEKEGDLLIQADAEPPAPEAEPEPAPAPVVRRAADGGLDIPLYDQYDIGAQYPNGYCGPTSMKMVLEFHGIEKDINDLALSDVGPNTPTYTPGNGSSHGGLLEMLRHSGLNGAEMAYGRDMAWLKEQTDAGNPCIVSVSGDYGAGFTTAGHILVVSGITEDGRVILNDSVRGTRRIVPGATFNRAWTQGSGGRMGISCPPPTQA